MKLFYRICTSVVMGAAAMVTLPAQTFTTIFNFGGTNGASPAAALVQGTDGYLYGTTSGGGITGLNCGQFGGCGTVFKITPNGTLTTLYSFCSFSQCPDGAGPSAPLVQTTNGEFYGTTSVGGSPSYCTSTYFVPGCGTVFKMTPSGLLTTIYSFCSQVACADGAQPMAGLVQGMSGVLYGTTSSGGANNGGTIFKITPDGTLTTLYSFCSVSGCADGEFPLAGLVQATNGDLYGTASAGGSYASCASFNPFGSGCGTVFRLTPSGTLKTLYSFCAQSGCADGAVPGAGLVQATNGDLYGTTPNGGTGTGCGRFGCGTVFEITSGGALTTLYSFRGSADGGNPHAGLIQATDGNLYGTNNFTFPTIFKITPAGSLTTLSRIPVPPSFSGGFYPALVQDTNGGLYGTTPLGTDLRFCFGGCGTIYSLSVGLGPFVRLQPASGEVGGPVDILGNNLTGATSVSFNGSPATFRVVSHSLITTNVPPGATTGSVEVTTPSGTVVSNVSFRVRQ